MHTEPMLYGEDRLLYHRHLQSDHDFEVWAEVLTMEEDVVVAEADILDGQINFDTDSDGPDRTASLVLSDPEGVLSFGSSFARDDTDTIWVNRILRINHRVDVPTLGEITAVAFVGVPVGVSRAGAEIGLELGDKSVLADHGVRPHNYKKGSNVGDVLRHIMRTQTGEHHLRIPKTRKRLSKNYKVGMGDDSLTPWQAFKKIAKREAGWDAFYSVDGFATCEKPRARRKAVKVEHLLGMPDTSASFTDFINYTRITSRRKVKIKGKPGKKDDRSVKMKFSGIGQLPARHMLSEESLQRNGVLRTLPLVVSDNTLKTRREVDKRVKTELRKGSKIESEQSVEIMPLFHLDPYDLLDLPRGIGEVDFDKASIPLGVGGNMSLGVVRWVSRPVTIKRARVKATVQRKRHKGGRKSRA